MSSPYPARSPPQLQLDKLRPRGLTSSAQGPKLGRGRGTHQQVPVLGLVRRGPQGQGAVSPRPPAVPPCP